MMEKNNCSLTLTIVCLLFWCGCEKSPKPEMPRKDGSAASLANSKTDLDRKSSSGDQLSKASKLLEATAPKGIKTKQESLEDAKDAQGEEEKPAQPVETNGNQSTATEAQETKNVAVVEIQKPTAEQLARWKQVSFEPLQLLARRNGNKTGFTSFVAVGSEGKQFVLGGAKLSIWDISGNQPNKILTESKSDDDRLLCFALSAVGGWCIAGDAKGNLRKFDFAKGTEIASKDTKTNAVVKVAISPDGKEIATIPHVSEITIWDAETLEKKIRFEADTREIKHLQYIDSKTLIASGESMASWDTSSGKKIKTFPAGRYQSSVALSPDGTELLFGAEEFLQRWKIAENQNNGEYRGVPARDSAVRFSSDGSYLAVASGDAIRILDATSGQLLQEIDASGSVIGDIAWVPQTTMLLVATDTGCTRIWGRPKDGEKFGLQPLHPPISVVSANPDQPVSAAENLSIIDLRILPKLPVATIQNNSFASINYTATVSLDEAKAFYRYILASRGWQEIVDQSNQYTILFQKHGFKLTLSPYSQAPKETLISISVLGNCELRRIPKLESFLKQMVYEGDTSVIYKVDASLLQIETELLRKLHQSGWTAIDRLGRSRNEEPNSRDFEFVFNGSVLRVSVQPDREDKSLFVISYGLSLTSESIPVPSDCGLMEWDDFRGVKLVANTKLNLAETVSFFDTNMQKMGWLMADQGRKVDKEFAFLPYYREQRDLTVALQTIPEGLVRIQVGPYESGSWQTAGASKKAATPDENSTPEEGLEAADVPIFQVAGVATYNSAEQEVAFSVEKISLKGLAGQYSEAMKTLGWTVKPMGDLEERNANLMFEKGSKIIYFNASIDPRGIGSVRLSGNGLLWNKAIRSTSLISYGAWLRNNGFPACLSRLDDYQKEMESLLDTSKSD